MQGDEKWVETRRGKLTASEISKICAPKGFGQTGETYIYSKVAELFCDTFENITSKEMQWGHDFEPFAKEYFKAAISNSLGEKINIIENDFDFFPNLEDHAGASLDGRFLLKNEMHTIEVKCPYTAVNHLKYSLFKTSEDLKKNKPEYYYQMQMQFICSGIDNGFFVSFHPNFINGKQMSVLLIKKDEEACNLITERIKNAVILKKEIIQSLL